MDAYEINQINFDKYWIFGYKIDNETNKEFSFKAIANYSLLLFRVILSPIGDRFRHRKARRRIVDLFISIIIYYFNYISRKMELADGLLGQRCSCNARKLEREI